MSRIIVISNRLPFSIDKTGDEISIRQSSGGLVSALKSYFEKPSNDEAEYESKLWIGSVDADEKDWKEAEDNQRIKSDFGIVPLFLDKTLYDAYYSGFANSVLWPLFHYFPSLADFQKEYFEAYVKINEAFAKKIHDEYQDGDVIWIHDYQLMLLPHLLRQSLPDATIGFFFFIYHFLPMKYSGFCLQNGSVLFYREC